MQNRLGSAVGWMLRVCIRWTKESLSGCFPNVQSLLYGAGFFIELFYMEGTRQYSF